MHFPRRHLTREEVRDLYRVPAWLRVMRRKEGDPPVMSQAEFGTLFGLTWPDVEDVEEDAPRAG